MGPLKLANEAVCVQETVTSFWESTHLKLVEVHREHAYRLPKGLAAVETYHAGLECTMEHYALWSPLKCQHCPVGHNKCEFIVWMQRPCNCWLVVTSLLCAWCHCQGGFTPCILQPKCRQEIAFVCSLGGFQERFGLQLVDSTSKQKTN